MRKVLLFSFVVLVAGVALAHHPIDGETMFLKQPDGSRVEITAHGDGWYARMESTDGYTVVRDVQTGWVCYAQLSADGQRLESTGIHVGSAAPGWLTPGLEESLKVRTERRNEVKERFEAEERAMLAGKARDPQPSSTGDVHGLTLLIDFADEVATVPVADFDAYLNGDNYTGYGNNGSVKEYFQDVSGGALTYTNWLPDAYIRAPQPKSYYEDPNVQNGIRARELVVWCLNELDDQGFDFSGYDANGDGYIDAVNAFYAGYPDGGWAVGLWPHSWVMSFYADGVSSYKYQITNIGASLRLSTFCHENGHMIMFWPDLYDYGYESSGVGGFCLMCSSGAGTNPVRPCGYLRAEAGWEIPMELTGLHTDLTASHDDMNLFRISYDGHPNEYYIIENRMRRGRDSSLPADGGLAIYHVDEYGSNDNEQQLPGSHYECTLVQADGRWDLENDRNNGDDGDLWWAPTYTQFDPTTTPAATWWDGSDAPLFLDNVSAAGVEMTFDFREALGTMAVTIQPEPAGLLASWSLSGPGNYLEEGAGYASMLLWDEGTYTLTWGDVAGWSEPDPQVVSFEIVDGGAPVTVVGVYSDPPFTLADAGVAGDTGAATGLALVDIDGDGDQDLHVINNGSADRLLRNDGGLVFTDITPAGLDDAGNGQAAAWADYDDDGDPDVYLVREDQANLMLEQDAGVFTDVAPMSYGFDHGGPGLDAQWVDYDRDGKLDLYLTQGGAANALFHNHGDVGTGHPLMLGFAVPIMQDAGMGYTASWLDFDLDGDRDVYLVNDATNNVLVANFNGAGFEDSGQSSLTTNAASRDAVWGDFDGDGDWDVYVANNGQADALYRRGVATFALVLDAAVNDAGASQAVAAADFDNDGNLDLYVARRGEDDLLIFSDGQGGFQRASLGLSGTDGLCSNVALADLDGDGGVDVYVGRDGQSNLLLRNTIQDRGHWLGLDLVGHETNLDAVGARVRVVVGETSQLREVTAGDGRSSRPHTLHLGLGDAAMADSVVVTWPDGEITIATDVAGDGVVTIHKFLDPTDADASDLPRSTRLHAAYPNPFNPSTTIAFDLARAGRVRVDIYALDGHRVTSLLDESRQAGRHELVWQGRDGRGRGVASGTYLCRMRTDDGVSAVRLMLVK